MQETEMVAVTTQMHNFWLHNTIYHILYHIQYIFSPTRGSEFNQNCLSKTSVICHMSYSVCHMSNSKIRVLGKSFRWTVECMFCLNYRYCTR